MVQPFAERSKFGNGPAYGTLSKDYGNYVDNKRIDDIL